MWGVFFVVLVIYFPEGQAMSLSAIQDNLVKTNLVQQTQSRPDEVARSQHISQVAAQAEQDRRGDQVVIMSQRAEQANINPDEERARQEQERKKREQEEDEDELPEIEEENASPHAQMHRINILA